MRESRLTKIELTEAGFRVVPARAHDVIGGMTSHHVLWREVQIVTDRQTAGRAYLDFQTTKREVVVTIHDGTRGLNN